MQLFVDCFAGYHQIWMDEEDAEKTAFITLWGMHYYKMMLFGLRNAGATYMRAMTTIFHDMIHKVIEVYVDDVIIKSKRSTNHIEDLRKFFNKLRSRFIAQSTVICELIFKMLKKDVTTKWTDDCQKAFDRIKEYLSTPPKAIKGQALAYHLVENLVDEEYEPLKTYFPDEEHPDKYFIDLIPVKIYDQPAYYAHVEEEADRKPCIALSPFETLENFDTYRIRERFLENGSWKLVYLLLVDLESELGCLVAAGSSDKAVKGQALADHLVENPVGGEYEPLKMYFPSEEVSFIGEDIAEAYDSWRMFFDGAANLKVVGIEAVLVSETGQHYVVSAKVRFPCTNNMAEYEAYIMGLNLAIDMNIQKLLELMKRFTKIEFKHVPRIQNEFTDVLSTLSSMIQHPDKNFIDPIMVKIHNQSAYYAHVKEETDGKSWFHDIKEYLARGEYPEQANHTQKCTLRRLSNHFFQSRGTMYRRMPDLGLLSQEDTQSWILLDDHGDRLHPICTEMPPVLGKCRHDKVTTKRAQCSK
ncbi:uncharacterized protein [Nicotiana sylvestris]|uniref:uncharacterized protein n=1 Tax=Nicotiana sylvestris TaxID=4096 RepID=UPI00388CB48D